MFGKICVRDILQQKIIKEVYSIGPRDTVFEALEKMEELNIGALLVMRAGKIVGMFTERDYARKVILNRRHSKATYIFEVMQAQVFYTELSDSVGKCFALMNKRKVRYLPVLVDGELKGIISMGDVVKTLVADQEFMINELERYIYGSHRKREQLKVSAT